MYDGREHVPIATLPGMFERTLTLSSAGKSYSFTGWKVGWATGPADARRRRARGQAVADLHLRLAAAAGRRASPSTRSPTSPPPWPPTSRPGATCCAPGWPTSGSTSCVAGGHLLRHHRHLARSAGPTDSRSAARCPSGPASSRSPPRGSTTPTPAGSWCAGRSARSPTSSRRASGASRGRPGGVVPDVSGFQLAIDPASGYPAEPRPRVRAQQQGDAADARQRAGAASTNAPTASPTRESAPHGRRGDHQHDPGPVDPAEDQHRERRGREAPHDAGRRPSGRSRRSAGRRRHPGLRQVGVLAGAARRASVRRDGQGDGAGHQRRAPPPPCRSRSGRRPRRPARDA